MSTDPTNNTDDDIIIDELASRLVDRDIDLADVPSELRAAVESRAAQFVTTRQQLLTSLPQADGSTIDRAVNEAINEALRNSQTQQTTEVKSRKFGVYIGALAAAAAVVAIVGVAITGPRTSDQSVSTSDASAKVNTDVMVTSGDPMAREMSAESFAPVADAAPSGGSSFSTPMAASSALLDPITLTDEYDLNSLISGWTASGLVVPEKIIPLCADANRPAVDAVVTFAEEPAEIHFTPQDGVIVYRISDCSVIIGIVP